MLPTETTFDVGLLGPLVAHLGVGEPLEQRGVCPGAVGEEFAHHSTELRTGHLGHLSPPSPAGVSAPKAPASRARVI